MRRKWTFRWTALLLFLAVVEGLYAQQDWKNLWEAGNQAYRQGSYAQAVDRYQALLQAGYASEALFYNLGNAYLRLDSLGPARLYLEKAWLLSPGDAEIRRSLDVLRSMQADGIIALPTFFLTRWWRGFRSLLHPSIWLFGAILFGWMLAVGIYFWQFGKRRKSQIRGFAAAIAGAALSVWCLALGWTGERWLAHPGTAVLMANEVPMRAAPDPLSAEERVLHAGVKVWLLDEIGDWEKVRLADGETGWVPQSVLQSIGLKE